MPPGAVRRHLGAVLVSARAQLQMKRGQWANFVSIGRQIEEHTDV
jgi:hypothetical protein